MYSSWQNKKDCWKPRTAWNIVIWTCGRLMKNLLKRLFGHFRELDCSGRFIVNKTAWLHHHQWGFVLTDVHCPHASTERMETLSDLDSYVVDLNVASICQTMQCLFFADYSLSPLNETRSSYHVIKISNQLICKWIMNGPLANTSLETQDLNKHQITIIYRIYTTIRIGDEMKRKRISIFPNGLPFGIFCGVNWRNSLGLGSIFTEQLLH